MRTFITGLLKGRRLHWSIVAAIPVALLALAWPVSAGVKQTVEVTGIYLAVDWGQAKPPTLSGNTHVKNLSAVVMMVSANPLLNGRLTWVGEWNGDAQLNGGGQGTGVFELGTWALTTDGWEFTPSARGGLWVTKWEVFGNPTGATAGKVMGHGVAGEVEGMQFDAAQTGSLGVDLYNIQLLDPHAPR
jgi:hypothetical protein